MGFDGFFCKAIARELNLLAGARVDKLFFISPAHLCLCLYKGDPINLVISAVPSAPFIAAASEVPLRPQTPDNNTMLYRKHLKNARLIEVVGIDNERIIRFEFDAYDPMGYQNKKFIYVEMMGRYSNIILCDEEQKILWASALSDITAERQVLPNIKYEFPRLQDKVPLEQALESKESFITKAEENKEKKAESFLVSNFFSFSPLIARELVYRTCKDTDATLKDLNLDKLYAELSRFLQSMQVGEYTPVMIIDEQGAGVDYSFTALTQYEHIYQSVSKQSLSELQEHFYQHRSESSALKRHGEDILKVITNTKARLTKKIVLQQEQLRESYTDEEYKKKGDLLTANLYRLKQGEDQATVWDYEIDREVVIPLDPRLTPANNAKKYYTRYTKLKTSRGILREQIQKAQGEILYMERVLDFVNRATEVSELTEIRQELTETGYIRTKRRDKKKKHQSAKPLEFVTAGGFYLSVGRNNKENDRIVSRADKRDIWFHVKGFHGSHVVLHTEGKTPEDLDITQAAMVAAYYSQKRESGTIPVDYTQVMNVKRPTGSPPGFVIFTQNKTAYVDSGMPEINKA